MYKKLKDRTAKHLSRRRITVEISPHMMDVLGTICRRLTKTNGRSYTLSDVVRFAIHDYYVEGTWLNQAETRFPVL